MIFVVSEIILSIGVVIFSQIDLKSFAFWKTVSISLVSSLFKETLKNY